MTAARGESSNAPYYRHPGLDPGSHSTTAKSGTRIKSGVTERVWRGIAASMAKLYFYYASMNAGKSTTLL